MRMENDVPTDELKYGIAIGVLLASIIYWLLGRLRSDGRSQPPDEMDAGELLASIDMEGDTPREYVEELFRRTDPQVASASPRLDEEIMDELAEFDIELGQMESVQDALDADIESLNPDDISLDEEADDGDDSPD